PVRLAIWFGLLLVADGGLLHLVAAPSGWETPLADLRDAGGIAGMAVAEPLRSFLGGWGAAAVFVGLGLVALLVLTRTAARDAARVVLDFLAVIGRGLRRVFRTTGRT